MTALRAWPLLVACAAWPLDAFATPPLTVAADPAKPDAPPTAPPLPTGYTPVSPFQDDLPCAFIPYPRCGPYPFVAFGVQGGAAATPVGWERIVRPYAEAGIMTSLNDWIDFGVGFQIAYDSLESISAYSFESKLRLRMWMPAGFFGDVTFGPFFERFAYPGTETGTRGGAVLGALFSFSELIGLEGSTVIAPDTGNKAGEAEFRYMLGVRFSLTTVVIVGGAIAKAAFK